MTTTATHQSQTLPSGCRPACAHPMTISAERHQQRRASHLPRADWLDQLSCLAQLAHREISACLETSQDPPQAKPRDIDRVSCDLLIPRNEVVGAPPRQRAVNGHDACPQTSPVTFAARGRNHRTSADGGILSLRQSQARKKDRSSEYLAQPVSRFAPLEA